MVARFPVAFAQVHVVETLGLGDSLQQLPGRGERLCRHVEQRAEVNPVGLEFGDALEFLAGEIDEIVGDGPHDAKRGLAIHVELDFRRARGFVGQHLHELGGHAAGLEQREGLASAGVGADSA